MFEKFSESFAERNHAIAWFAVLFVTLFILVVAFACSDGCDVEDTRCAGAKAEVCNSSGNWELGADCSGIEDFALGIQWACCVDPLDGLHSCLPADECAAGMDAGVEGGI